MSNSTNTAILEYLHDGTRKALESYVACPTENYLIELDVYRQITHQVIQIIIGNVVPADQMVLPMSGSGKTPIAVPS